MDIFTTIYKNNGWGSKESVSGTGSELMQTLKLRHNLIELIKKYNIKSILDGACGDFNWFKEIIKEVPIKYIGYDIVSDLITSNIKKYANENVRFVNFDIINDPLIESDLMIVRDCLVHLSYTDINKFIINLKESNIKYLLTISFFNFENYDINTGSWRPLCLTKPPFNYDKYLEVINEGCTENEGKYIDKSLILYEVCNDF